MIIIIVNYNNNYYLGLQLIEWLNMNGCSFPKLILEQYAPEVRGVHCHEVYYNDIIDIILCI